MGTILVLMPALWACQDRGRAEPPIAGAVRANDVARVAALLDGGESADAASSDGHTLVYLATGPRGGIEVLALLLERGANPHIGTRDGRTPLINAAGWCDAEMVSMLLAAGADPSYAGPDGKTARESVCSAPAEPRAAVLAVFDRATHSGF